MSIFYLHLIFLQLLFVLFFTQRLKRFGASTTVHYVLCCGMLLLLGYEFVREIRIFFGAKYLMNEARLIILRLEHTILGMFVMEVIRHAKILHR